MNIMVQEYLKEKLKSLLDINSYEKELGFSLFIDELKGIFENYAAVRIAGLGTFTSKKESSESGIGKLEQILFVPEKPGEILSVKPSYYYIIKEFVAGKDQIAGEDLFSPAVGGAFNSIILGDTSNDSVRKVIRDKIANLILNEEYLDSYDLWQDYTAPQTELHSGAVTVKKADSSENEDLMNLLEDADLEDDSSPDETEEAGAEPIDAGIIVDDFNNAEQPDLYKDSDVPEDEEPAKFVQDEMQEDFRIEDEIPEKIESAKAPDRELTEPQDAETDQAEEDFWKLFSLETGTEMRKDSVNLRTDEPSDTEDEISIADEGQVELSDEQADSSWTWDESEHESLRDSDEEEDLQEDGAEFSDDTEDSETTDDIPSFPDIHDEIELPELPEMIDEEPEDADELEVDHSRFEIFSPEEPEEEKEEPRRDIYQPDEELPATPVKHEDAVSTTFEKQHVLHPPIDKEWADIYSDFDMPGDSSPKSEALLTEKEDTGVDELDEEPKSNRFYWILGGILLAVIFLFAIYFLFIKPGENPEEPQSSAQETIFEDETPAKDKPVFEQTPKISGTDEREKVVKEKSIAPAEKVTARSNAPETQSGLFKNIYDAVPYSRTDMVYTDQGRFYVQIMAIGDKARAEKEADKLIKKGYKSFITYFNSPKGLLYRVNIGYFNSSEEAKSAGVSAR